jgi:hypothetical protein
MVSVEFGAGVGGRRPSALAWFWGVQTIVYGRGKAANNSVPTVLKLTDPDYTWSGATVTSAVMTG